MIEEIHDRTYGANRSQLHETIDGALERIRCGLVNTFNALHDIQFAAPWTDQSKRVRCA